MNLLIILLLLFMFLIFQNYIILTQTNYILLHEITYGIPYDTTVKTKTNNYEKLQNIFISYPNNDNWLNDCGICPYNDNDINNDIYDPKFFSINIITDHEEEQSCDYDGSDGNGIGQYGKVHMAFIVYYEESMKRYKLLLECFFPNMKPVGYMCSGNVECKDVINSDTLKNMMPIECLMYEEYGKVKIELIVEEEKMESFMDMKKVNYLFDKILLKGSVEKEVRRCGKNAKDLYVSLFNVTDCDEQYYVRFKCVNIIDKNKRKIDNWITFGIVMLVCGICFCCVFPFCCIVCMGCFGVCFKDYFKKERKKKSDWEVIKKIWFVGSCFPYILFKKCIKGDNNKDEKNDEEEDKEEEEEMKDKIKSDEEEKKEQFIQKVRDLKSRKGGCLKMFWRYNKGFIFLFLEVLKNMKEIITISFLFFATRQLSYLTLGRLLVTGELSSSGFDDKFFGFLGIVGLVLFIIAFGGIFLFSLVEFITVIVWNKIEYMYSIPRISMFLSVYRESQIYRSSFGLTFTIFSAFMTGLYFEQIFYYYYTTLGLKIGFQEKFIYYVYYAAYPFIIALPFFAMYSKLFAAFNYNGVISIKHITILTELDKLGISDHLPITDIEIKFIFMLFNGHQQILHDIFIPLSFIKLFKKKYDCIKHISNYSHLSHHNWDLIEQLESEEEVECLQSFIFLDYCRGEESSWKNRAFFSPWFTKRYCTAWLESCTSKEKRKEKRKVKIAKKRGKKQQAPVYKDRGSCYKFWEFVKILIFITTTEVKNVLFFWFVLDLFDQNSTRSSLFVASKIIFICILVIFAIGKVIIVLIVPKLVYGVRYTIFFFIFFLDLIKESLIYRIIVFSFVFALTLFGGIYVFPSTYSSVDDVTNVRMGCYTSLTNGTSVPFCVKDFGCQFKVNACVNYAYSTFDESSFYFRSHVIPTILLVILVFGIISKFYEILNYNGAVSTFYLRKFKKMKKEKKMKDFPHITVNFFESFIVQGERMIEDLGTTLVHARSEEELYDLVEDASFNHMNWAYTLQIKNDNDLKFLKEFFFQNQEMSIEKRGETIMFSPIFTKKWWKSVFCCKKSGKKDDEIEKSFIETYTIEEELKQYEAEKEEKVSKIVIVETQTQTQPQQNVIVEERDVIILKPAEPEIKSNQTLKLSYGIYVGDTITKEDSSITMHGKGLINYNDGSKFDGFFDNGIRVKEGTYIFSNGDKYIGTFNNVFHGFGYYYHKNGNIFYGEFVNGKKEGFGIVFEPNGNWVVNNYKENKKMENYLITILKDMNVDNSIMLKVEELKIIFSKKDISSIDGKNKLESLINEKILTQDEYDHVKLLIDEKIKIVIEKTPKFLT